MWNPPSQAISWWIFSILPIMWRPELHTVLQLRPDWSFIKLERNLPAFVFSAPTDEGHNPTCICNHIIYLWCCLQRSMDLYFKVPVFINASKNLTIHDICRGLINIPKIHHPHLSGLNYITISLPISPPPISPCGIGIPSTLAMTASLVSFDNLLIMPPVSN